MRFSQISAISSWRWQEQKRIKLFKKGETHASLPFVFWVVDFAKEDFYGDNIEKAQVNKKAAS